MDWRHKNIFDDCAGPGLYSRELYPRGNANPDDRNSFPYCCPAHKSFYQNCHTNIYTYPGTHSSDKERVH